MLWIGTAVTWVAGIVALLVVILTKRHVNVDQLGSVRNHWMPSIVWIRPERRRQR